MHAANLVLSVTAMQNVVFFSGWWRHVVTDEKSEKEKSHVNGGKSQAFLGTELLRFSLVLRRFVV